MNENEGEEVAFLGLIDCGPTKEMEATDSDMLDKDDPVKELMDLIELVEKFYKISLGLSYEVVAAIEEVSEQLSLVKEKLEDVGFLPAGTELMQVKGLLRVFKANHKMFYYPEPLSGVQLTLFRSEEQTSEIDDVITNFAKIRQSRTYGWDIYSDREVMVAEVPGSHITLMSEPHVQVLGAQLSMRLGEKEPELSHE